MSHASHASHANEGSVAEMALMPQLPEPAARLLAPQPSNWNILKTMLKKHIYVARKRRRLLTSVWPAALYCVISVILYHVFDSLDVGVVRALLLALIIPFYLVLAVMGALQCAIVEIVTEKESKMKITQEIYGLTAFMYWLSWGAYFFLVALICMVVIYAMLTLAAPVVAKSSPLLVLILLGASYVQQLEFAAIISIFFNKVQTASALASALTIALIFLGEGMQGWLRDEPRIWWYLGSLLPSVNLFNGFAALMFSEALYYCDAQGCYQGMTLKTLWVSEFCVTPYRPGSADCATKFPVFSAGESLVMILVDICLYAFVAWWLEQVWQGDFGRAKPWLFCLQPAYMCPHRSRERRSFTSLAQQDHLNHPAENDVAMSIRNLRKVFKGKVAVDGMDLEVRRGEIFALLGHNGAGKTTCMNCVVGLVPMTSGDATVNGFDVRTDLDAVRRNISVCPQDNPLYNVFTVRQHLMFFASLRGVSEQLQAAKVMEVLTALGIPEKVDDLCTSLSGGQKRRLWVATALLGETPVVFLDEPTSGMDPSSRRQLWELLLRMRTSGRSIIFTTHYLEEADVLADRKAVLARGKVQACGTSRDLKLQFGLGYNLQVQFTAAPGTSDLQGLLSLIRKHVPSAAQRAAAESSPSLSAVEDSIVAVTLPYQEVSKFGPMLIELDGCKQALNVTTYSISMTTLEEVFMALGHQAEQEAAASGQAHSENTDFRDVEAEPEGVLTRPETSERRSAKAMMRLRLRLATANRSSIYSVLVLPIILNIACFASRGGSSQSASEGGMSDIMLVTYPPMAFGVSIIAFTLQLVREREVKCKHVALAQGLSVRAFWLGTLMAHYLVNVVNAVVLLLAIQWRGGPKLTGSGFPMLIVEAMIYPVSLLLMAYNVSMLFTQVELAVKVLPLTNMLLGTIPTTCVYLLLQLPEWLEVARGLHAAMSLLNPVYGLPGMVLMMYEEPHMTLSELLVSRTAIPLYGSVVVIAMLAMNLVYQDARSRSAVPGDFQEFDAGRKDDDVLTEESRVNTSIFDDNNEDAAMYHELHHTYRTWVQRKKLETPAVRGISLGIRSGECFGLLGPNGAGKTTTLAVLTGEVRPPTAGQVRILGHDVTTVQGMHEAFKVLGVCPQVDPLWEYLSATEHLLFFGRIKGVPEAALPDTIKALLYRLGLDSMDAKRKTVEYSGGMKRKLSLAIALIGRSPLLFLDEPSAAVDAGAKRHLWKVIQKRGREQTVVVTTHSMEEAEALCNRIAIQVRGQLRCLGSPMHIKSKYGSGYKLELFCECAGHAQEAKTQELSAFLSRLAPGSFLEEQHSGRYLFQLPSLGKESVSLGIIFSEVQQNMASLGLSDYSITQPSLEQVFVNFAREQEDEDAQEA